MNWDIHFFQKSHELFFHRLDMNGHRFWVSLTRLDDLEIIGQNYLRIEMKRVFIDTKLKDLLGMRKKQNMGIINDATVKNSLSLELIW